MKSYKKIKALDDAFDILEYCAVHPREVSASEISLALDIPKASVMSCLQQMAERKYLDSIGNCFDLGPKPAQLWAVRKTKLESRKAAIESELTAL